MSGRLVVVATPIGNLADLSPRAGEALSGADLVLAEDTRHTGRMLAHLGIDTPQRSLHEHNEAERLPEVVGALQEGKVVALVSDAGTPGVSDPGYRLVAACVAAGIEVTAVPGPSAVLHALVVSGLPTDRFCFEGFLPRKGRSRAVAIRRLADEDRTCVLFLSPHRAAQDLLDLADGLGDGRPAAVCRELTKLHEEVLRGPLDELAAAADGLRGEITLVIGPRVEQVPAPVDDDALVGRVRELIATGMNKKAAIAAVARATGRPKREVYQAVVDAGS